MDFLAQYGYLRGFNYVPSTAAHDIAFWRDYDRQLVESELLYAQRLGLNSARVFLSYVVYEHDPAAFLDRVRHFLRAAHARDISVMLVVWDSCFDDTIPTYEATQNHWIPNPGVQRLGADFWPAGERYCRDLVDELDAEPGLLMWDVMNEPLVTSWLWNLPVGSAERLERTDRIWSFVKHFCEVVKATGTRRPITVGVGNVAESAVIGAAVDVLSFHDYSSTRAAVQAVLNQGITFANQFARPVLISETACLARGNPYAMTLELCGNAGMGWYLWELMIGVSRWRAIHGVVYPDGTVRDPSIVAAIQGFFRRRGDMVVPPEPDKEGLATRVTRSTEQWLQTDNASYVEGLLLLEQLANLIEACELLPMYYPPSRAVLTLQEGGGEEREMLAHLLREWTAVVRPYLE